jgi:hypothetical protein
MKVGDLVKIKTVSHQPWLALNGVTVNVGQLGIVKATMNTVSFGVMLMCGTMVWLKTRELELVE